MSDNIPKFENLLGHSKFMNALVLLVIFGLGGLIFIFFFASQMNLGIVLSVFGASVLVGGASFFLGGLLGFLFGIPKTAKPQNQSEGATGQYKGRYVENTNLEDISDWLTKIIIGVGLVDLSKIPQLLNQYAEMIAPVLGGIPSSKGFAIAISIYYSIIGFLFVYLATRAYMESGLELLKKKEIDNLNAQKGELSAELAELWTNKGNAFRGLGKTAEADAAIAKAKELGYKGKCDEAMQAYDKATEIDPEYKEAWYNKGIALADQGKYDDAIKAYDKAIEINPKYAEAWHNKGIALEKRGRTKVANDARKDADASAANAAIKNAIMYGYKS